MFPFIPMLISEIAKCGDVLKPRYQVVSPFPAEHLPKFWEWCQQFSWQMLNDAAPTDYEAMMQHLAQLLAKGGKTYGVLAGDGLPLGAVWGDFQGDGQFLGHLVFERDGLSSREKIEATRAVLRQWFADGAFKIYWEFFADNLAFQRFLEKMGANFEGRLRLSTRRNGERTDMVIMASFVEDIE